MYVILSIKKIRKEGTYNLRSNPDKNYRLISVINFDDEGLETVIGSENNFAAFGFHRGTVDDTAFFVSTSISLVSHNKNLLLSTQKLPTNRHRKTDNSWQNLKQGALCPILTMVVEVKGRLHLLSISRGSMKCQLH